ncbi:TPR repeat protein, SEL1 subfamily [Thermoplasmatales archaeon BRNA1]|nr:TPR repeat protein, SEL1 subfamily [Thermoplasmatales archaeon BRNA1]
MMDVPQESSSREKETLKRHIAARKAYESGKQDLSEEKEMLRKNSDDPASMVLLGVILINGGPEEKSEAVRLFEEAGKLGNSSGYRNLGYCYAVGLGVEKDKAKGAEIYALSADMGNGGAMCNLGVMYSFGNGVEQDDEKAFQCYLASAEKGYQRGMTNLGEYYLWGRGTLKDVAQAEKWFHNSGSARADYRLAEIYLDEPDWKDPEIGNAYLERACEKKYSRAMVRYGETIEAADREKAISLYNEAASKGNKDAISKLESMGLPVPESMFGRKKKSD